MVKLLSFFPIIPVDDVDARGRGTSVVDSGAGEESAAGVGSNGGYEPVRVRVALHSNWWCHPTFRRQSVPQNNTERRAVDFGCVQVKYKKKR